MSRIIFQCFVEGESLAGFHIRRYSRRVFTDPRDAEKYLDEFVAKLSDERQIDCLDAGQPFVKRVHNLELVES